MDEIVITQSPMEYLDSQKRVFELMRRNNTPPGIDPILTFLIRFEQIVQLQMPNSVAAVSTCVNKWANIGLTASGRNNASDINWGSDMFDRLFDELKHSLTGEVVSN